MHLLYIDSYSNKYRIYSNKHRRIIGGAALINFFVPDAALIWVNTVIILKNSVSDFHERAGITWKWKNTTAEIYFCFNLKQFYYTQIATFPFFISVLGKFHSKVLKIITIQTNSCWFYIFTERSTRQTFGNLIEQTTRFFYMYGVFSFQPRYS